jgi:hypothetical protein
MHLSPAPHWAVRFSSWISRPAITLEIWWGRRLGSKKRQPMERVTGGEAGIRTLRPRLSNLVMARDFWRQGFEFQLLTSFSSSARVPASPLHSTRVVETFWRGPGSTRSEPCQASLGCPGGHLILSEALETRNRPSILDLRVSARSNWQGERPGLTCGRRFGQPSGAAPWFVTPRLRSCPCGRARE